MLIFLNQQHTSPIQKWTNDCERRLLMRDAGAAVEMSRGHPVLSEQQFRARGVIRHVTQLPCRVYIVPR